MTKEITTVGELRKKLKQYPASARILIFDYNNSETHPILACSPFDDLRSIHNHDNFITIDFEK